ncbi:hypothetical protein K7432_016689 [Basidiobolus ranarum]|uniref:Uncharacterized protein n=1 Tax=Basidiobolus ranarum TaxID=34480 RepID=A0ABR2WEC6_9FUNG
MMFLQYLLFASSITTVLSAQWSLPYFAEAFMATQTGINILTGVATGMASFFGIGALLTQYHNDNQEIHAVFWDMDTATCTNTVTLLGSGSCGSSAWKSCALISTTAAVFNRNAKVLNGSSGKCALIPNSESYASCDAAVKVFDQEKRDIDTLLFTFHSSNGYSASTSVTRDSIAALIRKEFKPQNINAQRYVCRSVDPVAIVTSECKRQTANAGKKHCVL